MKKLIPEEALASAAKLPKDNFLVTLLSRVARIDEVNELYNKICSLSGMQSIEELFRQLDLHIEFDEKQLERIPKSGAFVVVANHPYGAIDGLALLYVISKVRPDIKVMANFLLQHVEPIKDSFIAVNPFGSRKKMFGNLHGLKAALQHVQDGMPLGIFPAGEVSTYHEHLRFVSDKQWENSALKIVRKANAPVIPVFFEGTNSKLFHLLGLISPNLRTLALPSEMLKMKGKTLRLKIGKPILPKDTMVFNDIERYGRFLRAKTYAIGSAFEVKPSYFKMFRFPEVAAEIVAPVPAEIIKTEIERIQEFKTLSYDNFDCFVVASQYIPHILNEIGRLREITFREVGEGTNKSIDLDEYDLYYQHLILWDRTNEKIVGAYRVGNGAEIMRRYGIKGFYISSLFKINKKMKPMLEESLELGRSFIVKEYQRHRLSLFLLWKGILHYLLSNSQFRYFIGPVSISNSYQEVSKELIIEFIKRHYYDTELAALVHPRNSFKPKVMNVDTDALLQASQADMKKMDQLISDIEPSSFTMPVLLKKYLQQNAKIISFNCDPKFNNALDGLIYLDLFNLPPHTVEALQREMNVE